MEVGVQLLGAASRIYSKQRPAFLCSSYLAFFSRRFVKVLEVQPYNSTNSAKNRSDFHIVATRIIK